MNRPHTEGVPESETCLKELKAIGPVPTTPAEFLAKLTGLNTLVRRTSLAHPMPVGGRPPGKPGSQEHALT